MALGATDLKTGVTILANGEVYAIVTAQHVKPGKGSAFVRTKLRNLKTQAVLDRTFRCEEKIEEAYIDRKILVYLYNHSGIYHFMDQENFEEVALVENALTDTKGFLKDNAEVTALFYKRQLLNIELPSFIKLKVTQTDPGVKGDTAKQALKPAVLETGLKIDVPLFINAGDIIKVDTHTQGYLGRV